MLLQSEAKHLALIRVPVTSKAFEYICAPENGRGQNIDLSFFYGNDIPCEPQVLRYILGQGVPLSAACVRVFEKGKD